MQKRLKTNDITGCFTGNSAVLRLQHAENANNAIFAHAASDKRDETPVFLPKRPDLELGPQNVLAEPVQSVFTDRILRKLLKDL